MGFCGVYSFLFFLSLLGFRLTRLTIPRSLSSFKGEAFSYLSVFSARQDFGIWVSSISQITFLVFQWTKGNCLFVFIFLRTNGNSLCLHPSTNKRQLPKYLHPSTNKRQLSKYLHPSTNKRQLPSFRSLKIYHV